MGGVGPVRSCVGDVGRAAYGCSPAVGGRVLDPRIPHPTRGSVRPGLRAKAKGGRPRIACLQACVCVGRSGVALRPYFRAGACDLTAVHGQNGPRVSGRRRAWDWYRCPRGRTGRTEWLGASCGEAKSVWVRRDKHARPGTAGVGSAVPHVGPGFGTGSLGPGLSGRRIVRVGPSFGTAGPRSIGLERQSYLVGSTNGAFQPKLSWDLWSGQPSLPGAGPGWGTGLIFRDVQEGRAQAPFRLGCRVWGVTAVGPRTGTWAWPSEVSG